MVRYRAEAFTFFVWFFLIFQLGSSQFSELSKFEYCYLVSPSIPRQFQIPMYQKVFDENKKKLECDNQDESYYCPSDCFWYKPCDNADVYCQFSSRLVISRCVFSDGREYVDFLSIYVCLWHQPCVQTRFVKTNYNSCTLGGKEPTTNSCETDLANFRSSWETAVLTTALKQQTKQKNSADREMSASIIIPDVASLQSLNGVQMQSRQVTSGNTNYEVKYFYPPSSTNQINVGLAFGPQVNLLDLVICIPHLDIYHRMKYGEVSQVRDNLDTIVKRQVSKLLYKKSIQARISDVSIKSTVFVTSKVLRKFLVLVLYHSEVGNVDVLLENGFVEDDYLQCIRSFFPYRICKNKADSIQSENKLTIPIEPVTSESSDFRYLLVADDYQTLTSPTLRTFSLDRGRDQNTVMDGLSANTLASALQKKDALFLVGEKTIGAPNGNPKPNHSFEWLHGIRFQFAGPENTPPGCGRFKDLTGNNPDLGYCPQTPYNLIFGTYEANSQMIVAENVGDWIRFQIDDSNEKPAVKLHVHRGPKFGHDSDPKKILNFRTQDPQLNPLDTFWFAESYENYRYAYEKDGSSFFGLRALKFSSIQTYPPHKAEDIINRALLYFFDWNSLNQNLQSANNNNDNNNNNNNNNGMSMHFMSLTEITSLTNQITNLNSYFPALEHCSFSDLRISGLQINSFTKTLPLFGSILALSVSGSIDFNSMPVFQTGPLSYLGINGELFVDLHMWPATSPDNYQLFANFTQDIHLVPDITVSSVSISIPLYSSDSGYLSAITVCGIFVISFYHNSPPFSLCASYFESEVGVKVSGSASQWIDAFDISGFILNRLQLTVDLSNSNSNIVVSASWNISNSIQFDVFGQISRTFSALGTHVYNLKIEDINLISNTLFGKSLVMDLDLIFDHIFFAVASSNGYFLSTSVVAGVNLVATFSFGEIQNATVAGTLGPGGLTLFATLSELPSSLTGVPFTLHDPTLFIMVSTDDTKPSELFIGVNITVPSPSGSLSVEALIYFQSNPSATIVAGDVKNIALSLFLPFAAGTPFDLHFEEMVVAFATGSVDPNNVQVLLAKFPALRAAMPQGGTGLSIIAKIDEVPLLSKVMDLSSAKLFLSYRMGTDSTSFSIIVDLTGAGGSTSSSHFNAVDLSIGVILSPTSYKLVVKFSMLVNLPGNGYPSTFSAVLTADPLVINLAASLTSTTAGAPAWKNAFGITNLNLINVGLDAGFSPESGLPDELGFSASMQIATSDGVVHELDVAVLAGADSQFVLKFEEYNIDLPFLVAFVETLIGYEIPGVETLASLTSMFTISHLLVYFSDGASIAGINYPAGGKLNMSASLFGKYDVANLVGEVLPSQGGGKFNGSLPHIELGPLIVSSFTDPSQGPSFGFEITKSSQQFWVNGAIQISSFYLGILLLISPSQLQFTFDLRVIPGLSVRITATAHGDIKDPLTASFSISGSFDISALLNLFQDALTESLAFFSDIGNGVDQLYQSSVQQFESATAALESGWSDAQAEVSQASLTAINVLASGGEIKQAAEAAYVAATDFASRAGEEGQLLIANANEIAGEVQDLAQKSLDQVQKFWGDQLSAAKGVVTDILSQLDRLGIHLLGVNRDGPRLRNKLMRLVSAHSSGHGPISAFNDSMKEASVNHESHGSFHPQFSLNPLDDINELIDDLRQAYDAAVRVVDLVVHELDVAVSAATSRLNDVVALGRQLVKEANDASHALSSLASDWENQASKAIQNIATLTSQLENQAANIVIEAEANVNIALGALKEGATATFNAVELAANKMTHVFKKVAALEDNFVHHPEDLISFQSASFHGNLGDLKTGSIGFTLVGVLCEQPFEQTFNLNLEETGSDLKDSILQYFLTSPCSPVSLFE